MPTMTARPRATPRDTTDLLQSRALAFAQQTPLLYVMLLANALLLIATQSNAPNWLRFYLPALLMGLCLPYLLMWTHTDLKVRRAGAMLASTTVVALLVGVTFSGWALALHGYGDVYQQAHLTFFIGVGSVACIFGLSCVPQAAVTGAIGIVMPFMAFALLSENSVLIVVAVNLLLVILAQLVLVLGHARNFNALVASRTEMLRQKNETQGLADENHRLANFDRLTGLPNRRSFDQELQRRLDGARSAETVLAVTRLDLDSFKSVNDIFGHATGDKVLCAVADRVRQMSLPTTFIARIDGDQFGIITEGALDAQALTARVGALCTNMRRPFSFEGTSLHVSASAGLAIAQEGDTAESLFDRADYAASVAKREARGTAVVFGAHHADDINRVRTMEHALREADLCDDLYIVFQPQYDMSLGRVTGYEVLARWFSPALGEVSPGTFIPLAERMGMIPKITQTVLRKALAVVDQLPHPMRLSVNLSAHDIGSITATEAIVALVEAGGTPCRIDFEITETAVMGDLEQANRALLSLLSLGSRIALDDFGTGHSSMTHVQRLPLDRIKIDRSFVAEVANDPASRAIIKTTIDLCRNLGISCVFEGIETEAQLEALVQLGGTVMQGYLFGRPMSEAAMLAQVGEQVAAGRPRVLRAGA